jgi:hypothetical protein
VTLPIDRGDREYQKFAWDTILGTVVKVIGNFSQAGLRVGMSITTFDVGDVAVALPPTAKPGRNAMSVANLSDTDTLYVGNSDVTADRAVGTTAGFEVGPGENINFDVTDAVLVYARCATGKTIRVKVMELA